MIARAPALDPPTQSSPSHPLVIPAKAGIQFRRSRWVPAFAGMTRRWLQEGRISPVLQPAAHAMLRHAPAPDSCWRPHLSALPDGIAPARPAHHAGDRELRELHGPTSPATPPCNNVSFALDVGSRTGPLWRARQLFGLRTRDVGPHRTIRCVRHGFPANAPHAELRSTSVR